MQCRHANRVPLEFMTQEEWDVFLETDRSCLRCERILKGRDFSVTTSRGVPYVRGWCDRCLKEYYASIDRKRQMKRRDAFLARG